MAVLLQSTRTLGTTVQKGESREDSQQDELLPEALEQTSLNGADTAASKSLKNLQNEDDSGQSVVQPTEEIADIWNFKRRQRLFPSSRH